MKKKRDGLLGVLVVVGVLWVGWLSPWWAANRVAVGGFLETARVVVWWLALCWVVGVVAWMVWGWWSGRSARAGGRSGVGWDPAGRAVFAVVPVRGGGGGRRRAGTGRGPRRRRRTGGEAVDFGSWLLRHASGLATGPGRVARVLWAGDGEGKLLWGLSIDRGLERSVKRAVGKVWPQTRIEPWPLEDRAEVSDSAPMGEGGGAVVRRLLAPAVLARPLHSPAGGPDHPMAPVADIMADHPGVDVRLVVDLVALSPSERSRVCNERLEGLEDFDPDRVGWETDDRRGLVEGVRVLLRVSRSGPGHLAECVQVADRVCRVLDTYWATDHNRLAVQKVSDKRFDEMWERGAVGRDVPCFHWDCLAALLAPPPVSIGRSTTSKRLPDPPRLETFHPQAPSDLMPIGALVENGRERMVGVSWGGPTDPMVDWTVGATGSGKTWHALSRVVALAETGRGFLFLDPHRTAVGDIKQFIGGRHADRIIEIDLQATNSVGTPMSAGWNPLDLTVVPEQMQKGRIDTLKAMLPVALFPTYFTADGKAPQTATLLRKTLECLLNLNYHLPQELQANIFCIENLLLDSEWRNLAISRLPVRDQKWWHHTFPMIVGDKGASSTALKPALNALELWKTQDRVQALLGASHSTLRWREIIEEGKILFVVLNNDRSETDNLLARLVVGEMIAAFKERSLTHQPDQPVRPYHLFLDEFQSYAPVLEAQAEVIVQELRKNGVKVHFINQSPAGLSPTLREIIAANRTHIFAGRLGNPKDAEYIAKAMGGQPRRVGSPQDPRAGPTSVDSRHLLGMPRWHFVCQVTQDGEPSSAFQVRGINVDQTWAHLKSDRDISQQIAENTGLEPVEQRLDHFDSLPERIARWLETTRTPGSYSNPPPDPPDRSPMGSFDRWISDCLVEDPDAATPTAVLEASYQHYCATHSIEPIPGRSFQQLLTQSYGPSKVVRVNGKTARMRRGIKPANPTSV